MNQTPDVNSTVQSIRNTLKILLDFKFLIKQEGQGLKSNLYFDLALLAIGFAFLLLGRAIFWSKTNALFTLFVILFFIVIVFLLACYSFYAWLNHLKQLENDSY